MQAAYLRKKRWIRITISSVYPGIRLRTNVLVAYVRGVRHADRTRCHATTTLNGIADVEHLDDWMSGQLDDWLRC